MRTIEPESLRRRRQRKACPCGCGHVGLCDAHKERLTPLKVLLANEDYRDRGVEGGPHLRAHSPGRARLTTGL